MSQIAETLRGLADGHVERDNLFISLAWCAGLLVVFGVIALRMDEGRVSE